MHEPQKSMTQDAVWPPLTYTILKKCLILTSVL